MLSSILYVSYSKILRHLELETMLLKSRSFNSKHEISGFLLYNGTNFVQYIEGEQKTISDLIERIKTDPRHENVLILDKIYIKNRIFPDWNNNFFDIITETDLKVLLKPMENHKIKMIETILKTNMPV